MPGRSKKRNPRARHAPTKSVKVKSAKSAAPKPRPVAPSVIYVLSDSTGNLARHMLVAALTQFPPAAVSAEYHTFLRTEHRLSAVLEQIKTRPGAVCHAMVSESAKRKVARFCTRERIPHHDLTGGLARFVADICGAKPRGDVAALHRLDESYKRRIGAMEFTIGHDDGLGLETLGDADIVLAGVSRTGKTPTGIYLAQQGYRVANVALAIEAPPPSELLNLPRGRVVGLVIDPHQLVMIRERRATAWRLGRTSYGDAAHVEREVAWARKLFARQGWPVLDVTDQAIEETAAKVLDVLGLSAGPAGRGASTELA